MRSRKATKRSSEVKEWFAELDRLNLEPFMKNGREQPAAPRIRYYKKGFLSTTSRDLERRN